MSCIIQLKLYNSCILAIFLYSCKCWAVTKRDVLKNDALDQWCQWKLLGLKCYHHVWNEWWGEMDNLATTLFDCCPSMSFLPVQPNCMNARRYRCQGDPSPLRTGGDHRDALVLRGWRLSSRTWILLGSPSPKWSNWRGSKLSIVETDVYVWCYTLLVVHARNEWMNATC